MRHAFVDKLDFLARPMAGMGCDWIKIKAILDLQLTLDARRKTAGRKKKGKQETGIFKTMVIMYGISGLFTALIVMGIADAYIRVSLGFFFIFLMAGLIMITDYSAIILDRQGQVILQTKPVDAKSLNVAKILHILVYMGFMTLVLGLPLLILEAIRDGFTGVLLCLLAYLSMDLITLVLTAFLYAGLLRLFSGEKLRDMIQMLQVAVTIIMVLSYQVFNQSIEFQGAAAKLAPAWWHLLLPSQLYATWMTKGGSLLATLLRGTSILLPIALIFLYLKLLAPRFDQMLARLDENEERVNHKKRKRAARFGRALAKIFTRSPEEAAGFLLGFRLLKRERKVQLIVIPQLALGVIFPLIFLLPMMLRGMALSEIRALPFYYSLCMTGFMVLPMGLYGMKSEYYQAAWIFSAAPVHHDNRLKRGLIKSFFVRYQLPVFLMPTLILMGIYGFHAMADILSLFFFLCFFARLNHRGFGRSFPFSEDIAAVQENRSRLLGLVFLNMALVFLVAGAHAAISFLLNASWALLAASVILAVYAWETDRFLKKTQV